jgi:hypothetical protein
MNDHEHFGKNTMRITHHYKEEAMKAAFLKRTMTAVVIIAMVAIALPAAVWALGTPAGTTVTNTVTVNYQIGGVPGAPVNAQATFTVDTKVNLTVVTSNATYVATAPSATGQILTYVVSNTSNTVLDFVLSAATTTDPFGGTDNFDATNVMAFFDMNANGVYDAGTDRTFIDNLATDATATVYITGDIPVAQASGSIAAYALLATGRQAGGAGALGAALTDGGAYNGTTVVFADGLADGTADATISARSAYRVTAVSVTKSAAVYSDPVNGTTSPRYIPGAVVTYTISITNPAGGSSATNVSIADAIGALPITFVASFNDGSTDCTGAGFPSGIVINNSCFTNQGGDDNADFNVSAANTVTVTGQTVNAGTTTTIKYQATVN